MVHEITTIMDLFRNDVKIKNGGYSVGLCMENPQEGLWRGWRFAMIGMKKYILSSNGNACVLLTFKNFRLVLLFQIHAFQCLTGKFDNNNNHR